MQHIVRSLAFVVLALAALSTPDAFPALAQDGKEAQRAADALLKRIADVSVQIDVDRDLGAAEKALADLDAAVNAVPPGPERSKLLDQLALAWGALLVAQGKPERALEVLRARESAKSEALKQLGDLGYGTDVETAALTKLGDLGYGAQRGWRIARAISELVASTNGQTDDEASLRAIVRDAVDRNDYSVVRQLGARVVPFLAEAVLAAPEEFPSNLQSDPLFAMVMVDAQATGAVVAAHLDAGGYLWKKRVLRALAAGRIFEDGSNWIVSGTDPVRCQCLQGEWLRVLEGMLGDPATAPDVIPLLRSIVEYDAFTAGLLRGMGELAAGPDVELANRVLQILEVSEGVVLGSKPIYERATKSSNAQVRLVAAKKLSHFERSSALLALADDPEPAVRLAVADVLGPHAGMFRSRGPATGLDAQRIQHQPVLDESERSTLRRMLLDSDERVRASAALKLVSLAPPFEEAVYLKLLSDPSPAVRRNLPLITNLPDELRGRILAALATDPSAGVVSYVTHALEQAPWSSRPAPYMAALLPCLEASGVETSLANSARQAVNDDDALRTLVFRALEPERGWLTDFVMKGVNSYRAQRQYARGPFEAFLILDDETLAAWFVHLARIGGQSFRWLSEVIFNADPARHGAMRRVLSNASVERRFRVIAGTLAARGGGEDVQRAVLGLLADASWKAAPPSAEEQAGLYDIGSVLPAGLLLAAVRNTALPDEPVGALLARYKREQELGRDITLEILKRFFRPDGSERKVVVLALEHLASLPSADVDPALLIAAVRHPDYAAVALRTMGALRRPEFLETLGACLEAPWILDPEVRRPVQLAAARALRNYMSDEAAELLLRGLTVGSPAVWNECTQGLSAIEEYHRRVRDWEGRKESDFTRESALAELLAMIESPDATLRAEAVRGLGTLGSPLLIPRLIPLLKDPAPEVQKAARESLDRLNQREAPAELGNAALEEDR